MAAERRVGQTRCGKWRLEKLIGTGGMGAVYASRHRNGRLCALKILHQEHTSNAEISRRFLQEGYVANAIGHPNVVRIDDDDRDAEGTPFLVMELLEGQSLDQILSDRGAIDEQLLSNWAEQVLSVLNAAHAKGIFHRDLKPENIFLTVSGAIKLLDFGIAHAQQAARTSTLTRDGNFMGTPAFMAPEQALGLWKEVDARTDLWAVGATMFTLLSGEVVHVGRTSNETLAKAMTYSARSLKSVVPEASEALAKVVDRALRFERGERWANAQEMLNALALAKCSPLRGEAHVPLRSASETLGSEDMARNIRRISKGRWRSVAVVTAALGLALMSSAFFVVVRNTAPAVRMAGEAGRAPNPPIAGATSTAAPVADPTPPYRADHPAEFVPIDHRPVRSLGPSPKRRPVPGRDGGGGAEPVDPLDIRE